MYPVLLPVQAICIFKALSKSYTALRKQREEFRKKLVTLILRKDDESSSSSEIPSCEEREILRYYYYIHHGIDTVHVAPLEQAWLEHIHSLIPNKLKLWTKLVTKLTDEIKEEFMLSVKKAIVDFVLQDPSQSDNRIKEYDSEFRRELKEMSTTWKLTFDNARLKMRRNLYTINPCLAQVLDLWHRSFKSWACTQPFGCNMRLVDIQEVIKSGAALDLMDFQQLAQKHIEAARDCLKTQWYPMLQTTFLQLVLDGTLLELVLDGTPIEVVDRVRLKLVLERALLELVLDGTLLELVLDGTPLEVVDRVRLKLVLERALLELVLD
ncbi:unnamed protein product [Timema podura]|uniref:Dynein heavy chain linker domain-containing protein n=1 Tax=Timema podura TaxID=61482 RepID=A0ABN7PB90_TIMPD|nr:unnamed protein product [Timema podura]